MSILLAADEPDIAEMTADVNMKKPHQKAFLKAWKVLMAAAQPAIQQPPSSPSPPPPQPPPLAAVSVKYVAAEKQIRLGQPEDSTHGVEVLLGVTDAMMAHFYQDPLGAIQREFATHGSAADQENLRCVQHGIKLPGWSSAATLESLLAHPNAVCLHIIGTLETMHD